MSILQFENISAGYFGNPKVLKGISFDVPKGAFLGVIGPNGSGKTTLLRVATKTLKPVSGTVKLGGEDIFKKSLSDIAKVVGVVTQNTPYGFSFSVMDIVLMGRYPHKKRFDKNIANDFEIAKNSLKLTDCLELADRDFDELSAGERQRVIIARSLTQDPLLLFLDEPTTHLDIGHEMQVFDLIKKLNIEKHLTIVAILHDLNLAAQFCDKLLLLDKGEVVKFGNPEDVLDYRIIEKVYKTPVVVEKSRITGKTFVNLVSNYSLEGK